MLTLKLNLELEHGNHEFKTAKKRLENLMEQWHSQEMDYFLQVFCQVLDARLMRLRYKRK